MFKLVSKTAIVALVTVSSISIASANGPIVFENVDNTQENLTDVFSNVNIHNDSIGSENKVEGSAVGNNFVVQAGSDDETNPVIYNGGQNSETEHVNATMDLNFDASPTNKFTNEAVANKSVLVSKGFGHNNITNDQNAHGSESIQNFNLEGATAHDLTLAATSGGNMSQFVLEGHNNTVNSSQTNTVMNESNVNINMGTVTDNLNVSNKAWGNSLVVVLGKQSSN